MVQPLDGVRVVDLTALVFGPLATKMLADLGAEIVKIEPLDGELTRHIEPMRSKAMGALFMHLNRGKKSLAVDLKDDRGRRIVERLATTADVFVHSMRQPAIERLGLDYPALRAQSPDIVYCAAWGFDRRGPFADHPAYDDIIQAASGLASLAGDSDGTPRYARTIIADKVGGLFAANAIMAALLHRRETGRGQFVEVPMMECLSWFVLAEHLGAASFEPAIGPPGHRRAIVDSRRPFATRDSHIAALPYTTAQWQRFLRHIGRGGYWTAHHPHRRALRGGRRGDAPEDDGGVDDSAWQAGYSGHAGQRSGWGVGGSAARGQRLLRALRPSERGPSDGNRLPGAILRDAGARARRGATDWRAHPVYPRTARLR